MRDTIPEKDLVRFKQRKSLDVRSLSRQRYWDLLPVNENDRGWGDLGVVGLDFQTCIEKVGASSTQRCGKDLSFGSSEMCCFLFR